MSGARGAVGEGSAAAGSQWRVSSFCAGGECVAVAKLPSGEVGIRDTKRPADPALAVSPRAFAQLIAAARSGALDE